MLTLLKLRLHFSSALALHAACMGDARAAPPFPLAVLSAPGLLGTRSVQRGLKGGTDTRLLLFSHTENEGDLIWDMPEPRETCCSMGTAGSSQLLLPWYTGENQSLVSPALEKNVALFPPASLDT